MVGRWPTALATCVPRTFDFPSSPLISRQTSQLEEKSREFPSNAPQYPKLGVKGVGLALWEVLRHRIAELTAFGRCRAMDRKDDESQGSGPDQIEGHVKFHVPIIAMSSNGGCSFGNRPVVTYATVKRPRLLRAKMT